MAHVFKPSAGAGILVIIAILACIVVVSTIYAQYDVYSPWDPYSGGNSGSGWTTLTPSTVDTHTGGTGSGKSTTGKSGTSGTTSTQPTTKIDWSTKAEPHNYGVAGLTIPDGAIGIYTARGAFFCLERDSYWAFGLTSEKDGTKIFEKDVEVGKFLVLNQPVVGGTYTKNYGYIYPEKIVADDSIPDGCLPSWYKATGAGGTKPVYVWDPNLDISESSTATSETITCTENYKRQIVIKDGTVHDAENGTNLYYQNTATTKNIAAYNSSTRKIAYPWTKAVIGRMDDATGITGFICMQTQEYLNKLLSSQATSGKDSALTIPLRQNEYISKCELAQLILETSGEDITKKESKKFGCESFVSRAEFARIVSKMLKLKKSDEDTYIPKDKTPKWALPYIRRVHAKGFMKGEGSQGQFFGATKKLKRVEAEDSMVKILSDNFKFTGLGKSTKSIKQELSGLPSASTPASQYENANSYNVPYCESNPNPVFTADITDFSKILYFIPPVTIQTSGQKGHGYVKIADKVPVYAPVDSVLYDGAYYSEENRGQFTLLFEVSCEVRYMFDHLSEVSEKIRKMFPSTPQSDTRSSGLPERISIKAGELIGYSIGTDMAKTWDFGVYNLTEENPFNDKSKSDADSFKNKNAVCPFSYFETEKRSRYMGILRNIDGSSLSNPTNLCR